MAYGYFKDLNRRTVADKVLCNKAFNIAKNPKYDGFQSRLASMVCKLFGKKSSGGTVQNEIISNKELTEKLHKPIRKFKKRKVYSSFVGNMWGTDLAGMQLISKFNKGFRFLLCVIDIYSHSAWAISVKDKGITITNAFQNVLNESKRKPNKIWLDKDSEFYNRSMKSFLKNNDIQMYSTAV